MQVGAPRGGERWYIKDGVMNDGHIIARQFRGYFDCGAYTRLSSYAVVKGTAHLPGPYTIPNVASNVYCVFTNRTPATAMRGFGVTGVDFSIECHMDKVAEEIGMDPIELRILNAYRDGDMKAHRRAAKNCALIECAQVAAEKATWPIAPKYKEMSSLRDGGGERAQIPHTITDKQGKIGERRRGGGVAPAYTPTPSISVPTAKPYTPPMSRPTYDPYGGASAVEPTTSSQPTASQPTQNPAPRAFSQKAVEPTPYRPASSYSSPASSTSESSLSDASTPTADSGDAYKPSEPFQKGIKRPGGGRFSSVSGTRRR